MKTKLTVIVDNIATDQVEGEWGLSILVEHGDTMVLVDTGIDRVCTGHCTKNRAFHIMKEELGERVEQFRIGMEMEF